MAHVKIAELDQSRCAHHNHQLHVGCSAIYDLGQLSSVWKWIFLLEEHSCKLCYKWHSLVQLLWFFRGKTKLCSQQGNLATSIYYKMWLHISACRMDSVIKKRKRALLYSNRHSESQKTCFNKIHWLQDRTVMTTFLNFSDFPRIHQY